MEWSRSFLCRGRGGDAENPDRECNCTALTDVSPLAESKELQTVTLPPNATNFEFLRTFPKLNRLSFTDPSNGYRPDKTAAEFWQVYDAKKK